jgi:integral membrane protein
MILTDADLPGVWRNADDESKRGQLLTLWLTGVKIGGGLTSAVGSIFSWHLGHLNLSAWVILIGFIVAFICEVFTLGLKPERIWYEGRAVAESVKTLAWRYAVCADPFPKRMPRSEAEPKFRQRISSITDQMSDKIIFDNSDSVISDTMSALRKLSFKERRDAYVQGRTLEQREWYSKKARANQQRATASWTLLTIVEIVAIILAVGRIFGRWNFDFAGLLAATISAGTAWVAVKQYSSLASAYSVATKELGIQASKLETVNEADWAVVAADAEEAISREHTTWLASRTGRFPSWTDT